VTGVPLVPMPYRVAAVPSGTLTGVPPAGRKTSTAAAPPGALMDSAINVNGHSLEASQMRFFSIKNLEGCSIFLG
jgi:hypothetical protein